MDNYIVSLWPGKGYLTEQIKVQATSIYEAFEAAMCYCQKMGLKHLYVDTEEVENDDLSEDEKEEVYCYVDPTTCDSACCPAFFRWENLGLEKVG